MPVCSMVQVHHRSNLHLLACLLDLIWCHVWVLWAKLRDVFIHATAHYTCLICITVRHLLVASPPYTHQLQAEQRHCIHLPISNPVCNFLDHRSAAGLLHTDEMSLPKSKTPLSFCYAGLAAEVDVGCERPPKSWPPYKTS
jgi:hypothetical protein